MSPKKAAKRKGPSKVKSMPAKTLTSAKANRVRGGGVGGSGSAVLKPTISVKTISWKK